MTTFAPIFVPAALREATSDAAWLQAMLDAERALALAESRLGLIPADAADSVAASCRAELFDIAELAERGRGAGNPVEPLVRALRERVGGEAADFVHWGATSQDILDSAAMLVSRRTVELILAELDGVATAAATLAEEHARTPMVARWLRSVTTESRWSKHSRTSCSSRPRSPRGTATDLASPSSGRLSSSRRARSRRSPSTSPCSRRRRWARRAKGTVACRRRCLRSETPAVRPSRSRALAESALPRRSFAEA